MSAPTGTGVADGVGDGEGFALAAPRTSLEAVDADVAGGRLADPAADGDVPHAAAENSVSKTTAMARIRIALLNAPAALPVRR